VTCDAGSTVTIELDSLKSQKTLPKKKTVEDEGETRRQEERKWEIKHRQC
jgi:hypothetical protein